MAVVVHINKFSGPMALLLHLIREQEMDIFDININTITKQYLDSIKAMKKLNLEMAGDFVAMAATLIQIKAKMLLPQYNEEGEVVETEDPRKDLVRRLLEYQMYQEAGQNLYKRHLLGRDTWKRGEKEEIKGPEDEILLEEDNALYSLISAYRTAAKNFKKAVHKVAQSLQSIADRIWEMRDRLVPGRPASFFSLLDRSGAVTDQRGHILITFLSLLELAKIGLVNLFQSDNFADIHVDTKNTIDRDSISKVESYESQIQAAENLSRDISINEADQLASDEAENLPLMVAASGDSGFSDGSTNEQIESATDADIEAEERKYEQETQV